MLNCSLDRNQKTRESLMLLGVANAPSPNSCINKRWVYPKPTHVYHAGFRCMIMIYSVGFRFNVAFGFSVGLNWIMGKSKVPKGYIHVNIVFMRLKFRNWSWSLHFQSRKVFPSKRYMRDNILSLYNFTVNWLRITCYDFLGERSWQKLSYE